MKKSQSRPKVAKDTQWIREAAIEERIEELSNGLKDRVDSLSQTLTDLSGRVSQVEFRPPGITPDALIAGLSALVAVFYTKKNVVDKLTAELQRERDLHLIDSKLFVVESVIPHSENIPAAIADLEKILFSMLRNGQTARVVVMRGRK